jgi:predicted amidohydrolase YtcJ
LARRRAGVDLSRATTIEDVKAELRAYRVRADDEPHWIGGGGWDPGKYGSPDRLGRELLDEVFGDRPVALEARDLHTLWCNTAALSAAGVMDGREATGGGSVGRREDGSPDGFLYETAWDLIWKTRPPESARVAEAWTSDAIAHAHSLGLTGVHCMEPLSTLETYRRLHACGDLKLRMCFHTPCDPDLDPSAPGRPPSYASDDPWFRLGGMKIFTDGSLGSRSAWMREPYPDGSHGSPLMEEEELLDLLLRAARARISGTVHAIGDAAVEMVTSCFERIREQGGSPGLLQRMEHAQCLPPDLLSRVAEARIYCAVQPVHLGDDVPLLPREWGRVADHAYPFRSMREAGIRLGFGSDAPVASLDPRLGIFAAHERRAGNRPAGDVWRAEESLPLEQILAAYTIDAASGSLRQDDLGSITVGKYADLVAFDDVLDEGAAAWLDARVRLTMVGGEIVHQDL